MSNDTTNIEMGEAYETLNLTVFDDIQITIEEVPANTETFDQFATRSCFDRARSTADSAIKAKLMLSVVIRLEAETGELRTGNWVDRQRGQGGKVLRNGEKPDNYIKRLLSEGLINHEQLASICEEEAAKLNYCEALKTTVRNGSSAGYKLPSATLQAALTAAFEKETLEAGLNELMLRLDRAKVDIKLEEKEELFAILDETELSDEWLMLFNAIRIRLEKATPAFL